MLVQALAELAYSIAMADGSLDPEEKSAFNEIIESELGSSAWSAKSRFSILEERFTPNIEQSYKIALFTIQTNKHDFTPSLRTKFISVLTRVADSVDGISDDEVKIIERFKTDTDSI